MDIRIKNKASSNTNPKKSYNINLSFFKRKYKDKHKTQLFSDLYLLTSSGLDVKAIFEIAISQYKDGWEKNCLMAARNDIIAGSSMSDALLSNLLINEFEYYAIKIGEESGRIQEILEDLKSYYEKKQKQKKQITTALMYPILVLCTAIIALGFMLNIVVPMFEEVFLRFQGDLPPLTKKIILISDGIRDNILLILILILGIFLCLKWLFTLKPVMIGFQRFQLRIPYLGKLIKSVYSSRFAHSMALLTSAKAPLVLSLKMVSNMISFYPLKFSIINAEKMIVNGKGLSESLAEADFFDRKFISLIKAAEEVNKLDYAFSKLNDQYNMETEYKLQILGNLIEPVLIIFVGGIVAVILIAMYMPLFQIGSSIY